MLLLHKRVFLDRGDKEIMRSQIFVWKLFAARINNDPLSRLERLALGEADSGGAVAFAFDVERLLRRVFLPNKTLRMVPGS